MPPWKHNSCCECNSSVAGTWSWMFCGVRGSGGSCRAWELQDWALEIPADVLHQSWYSEVAHSEAVILHLLILLRGSFRLKRKTQSNTWCWNTSFPHHTKRKAGFAWPEANCAGIAPLLFLCVPHGEGECRLLRAAEVCLTCCWLGTAQLVSCIEIMTSV